MIGLAYVNKKKTEYGKQIVDAERPICGKMFVPAPYHRYKLLIGSRWRLVCSYPCETKGLREKEEAHRRKIEERTARKRALKAAKAAEGKVII